MVRRCRPSSRVKVRSERLTLDGTVILKEQERAKQAAMVSPVDTNTGNVAWKGFSMTTNGLRWTIRLLGLAALACARVAAATQWSAQDYDLVSGDFNGDGKTDILYIAKDPGKVSGIALSDGSGPIFPAILAK